MRCNSCGITRNKTNQLCWQKFHECGKCASKNHPEFYPKNISSRKTNGLEEYDQRKTSVNGRKLCNVCNSTMPKLYNHARATSTGVDVWYCSKCKIIQTGEKIRILKPLEVLQ